VYFRSKKVGLWKEQVVNLQTDDPKLGRRNAMCCDKMDELSKWEDELSKEADV